MKKTLAMALAMALTTAGADALELPAIIGDHMTLQQQTDARLWGWATPGSTVRVKTSWDNATYTATAGDAGRWDVAVATPAASLQPYTIGIEGDGETRSLTDVLIGEVWFCSGQSNMEMPLAGFWNCPVEGGPATIARSGAYRGRIRVATVPKADALEPQDRVGGEWEECCPQNAGRFSAVGYYFAQTLTDLLGVPVGIINCSWGGSCVEGWLPKDTLLTYPDGLTPIDDADYHRRMVMFNGMLHPLAGYTIRGFLWNQGESNVGQAEQYIARFQTMTRLWRSMWGQGDLPMYTVELPPYWYDDADGEWGARLREAQHVIAHELERSGCVCTNDLAYDYEVRQIHGCRKREIGERLALMAATRDYGLTGFEAEAPELVRAVVSDAAPAEATVVAGTAVAARPEERGPVVRLYFSHAREGFDRLDGIEGFEAAGDDGAWHPATVWADSDWRDPEWQGCYLRLTCPAVSGPLRRVRYNFRNWAPGHLHGVSGLPVVPFETTL